MDKYWPSGISEDECKAYLIHNYSILKKSALKIANELGLKSKQRVLITIDKFQIPRNKKKDYKGRAFVKCGEITERLFKRYRDNAKNRNIEFKISIEYLWDVFLKQNRKCALSQEISIFSSKQAKTIKDEQTASLDRIDSSKGYIEGNVQWIHKKINKMKADLEVNEFIQFCKNIARYN